MGGLRVRSTSRVEETRPEFREGMFEHGEAGTDDSGIGFDRSPDVRGKGAVRLIRRFGVALQSSHSQD